MVRKPKLGDVLCERVGVKSVIIYWQQRVDKGGWFIGEVVLCADCGTKGSCYVMVGMERMCDDGRNAVYGHQYVLCECLQYGKTKLISK